MAGLNITNEQFQTTLQSIQNRYIKIELLNYQYQTVDMLEGVAIEGNITIDANSDIRRTASISLVVNDSSFNVQPGGKVWLDKYIRLWVGTESIRTGEVEWTNCGLYIIDTPSYQYDAVTNTLSLSLLDLMAKMTGIRNGYLPGLPVVYKAGENIRQAIIDTIALAGFTRYVVDEAPSPGTIPVDLEFSQGVTVYDLLVGLRDIYPFYEMFFDVDGTFYYKQIPTGKDDPIVIDDTLWKNIVVSESIDVDFQNVKNAIEVYGRTHDPAHFSTETTVTGNTINLTIPDVTEYSEGMIYGFTLTDNPGYTGMNLKINNLATLPISIDGITPAEIVAESGEIYYCVVYKGTYWNWLGHLQAYGYAEDDNPDSPFYVNGTVGKILLPLFDGDYANCLSDNLAQQRAAYELWLHTNMNNTIDLSCVPVFWMPVNAVVNYTPQRETKPNLYIIKSVNLGLSPANTMTINMIQFYPTETDIV